MSFHAQLGPFDDEGGQEDIKHLPFNVKAQKGMPVIEVEVAGKNKTFKPEEMLERLQA